MATTVNQIEYAFVDIQTNILGRDVEGFQDVTYTTNRDHQNVIGKGARPVAMTRGNKAHTGSVTLLQGEVEQIQEQLPPGQDLTDIPPFPIIVSYAPEGGVIKTDVLEKCRFRSVPKGHSEGDVSRAVQLELAIFNIKYNV